MPRVLIAPTAFKGTLTPSAAAAAIESGLKASGANWQCVKMPLADGGDGTLEALQPVIGARLIAQTVSGPLGEKVQAVWLKAGSLAVVELASACGIAHLKGKPLAPLAASTFGLGELIAAAGRDPQIKNIVVALGGSASTDGGMGALCALGVRFFDVDGKELAGCGRNLLSVQTIDDKALTVLKQRLSFLVLSDISNPLTGPRGAAAVFAPQKGADLHEVELLERGLAHYADIVATKVGADLRDLAGAGAAGGTAFGLIALLEAKLESGANWICRQAGLENALKNCDLVITGEGRFCKQSLDGKLISLVIEKARAHSRPIWIVSGAPAQAPCPQGVEKLISVCPDGEALASAEDIQNALRQAACK